MKARSILLPAIAFEIGLGAAGVALATWFDVPLVERLAVSPAVGKRCAMTLVPMIGLLAAALHATWGPIARLRRLVQTMVYEIFGNVPAWGLVAVSIAAGAGEELLFRGALQPLAERWMNPLAGLVVVSVLFGALHAMSAAYFILATAVGAYFGWIAQRYDDLVTPMFVHAAYDLAALVALLRGARGIGNRCFVNMVAARRQAWYHMTGISSAASNVKFWVRVSRRRREQSGAETMPANAGAQTFWRDRALVRSSRRLRMSITRAHHRFSVAEYEEMIDRGILTEDDRVELIRGEIIEKMSVGEFHAACVKRLNRLFNARLSGRVCVGVQDPIRLAGSEPEPDVSLLAPRDDDYASSHPEPADIMLVVEVADVSLDYDRTVKRDVYADNGIIEYWILNLLDRTLEVHRQPLPTGVYAEVRVLTADHTVEPVKLPGAKFTVAELFPPVS